MPLTKVDYVNGVTKITAENLNDIQDAIKNNETDILNLQRKFYGVGWTEQEIEALKTLLNVQIFEPHYEPGDSWPDLGGTYYNASGFVTKSSASASIFLEINFDKSIENVDVEFQSYGTGGGMIFSCVGGALFGGSYLRVEDDYECRAYKKGNRAVMYRIIIPNPPAALVTRTPIAAQILGNFVFKEKN